MPPKIYKILDFVTDGVKSSSKYWDNAVRAAKETSTVTPGLRVPLNSVQRKGYLDLQHAQSQYKYFQNPRLARPYFEQIAPLSEFQRYLPKGQIGDPFGIMRLLEGVENPYLRSVHKELKSFYPIGKKLGLTSDEIKLQMDLRLRDLLNNIYRVNTPMIFKLGGKIEKFQKGKLFKPFINYAKGVTNRTAEAIIRAGDLAQSPALLRQMLHPTTLKYIFHPNRPNLAYNLPFKYSGLMVDYMSGARPGDVVDIFLGKTAVPNDIEFSKLPLEIQSYLTKNYNGSNIITRNLGEVPSIITPNSIHFVDFGQGSLLPGQSKKLKGTFETGVVFNNNHKAVLDPGGYNLYATRSGDDLVLDAYDVWKFKPTDYGKRYNVNIRKIGLKFIDSQGNPIVSTWRTTIPNYFGQPLKLDQYIPPIRTFEDKIYDHWNHYGKWITAGTLIGGSIYGTNKILDAIHSKYFNY